ALRKEPAQPFAHLNLAAVAIKQNNFKLAHKVLADPLQAPIAEPKAQELLAVLESKESGRINLLRLRLAARTGPPDWSLETRHSHEQQRHISLRLQLSHCADSPPRLHGSGFESGERRQSYVRKNHVSGQIALSARQSNPNFWQFLEECFICREQLLERPWFYS